MFPIKGSFRGPGGRFEPEPLVLPLLAIFSTIIRKREKVNMTWKEENWRSMKKILGSLDYGCLVVTLNAFRIFVLCIYSKGNNQAQKSYKIGLICMWFLSPVIKIRLEYVLVSDISFLFHFLWILGFLLFYLYRLYCLIVLITYPSLQEWWPLVSVSLVQQGVPYRI